MKMPHNLPGIVNKRISILFLVATILAGTFWIATAPRSVAAPSACTGTICHKRTQTLSVPCNSLEYRRHKDHGDTDGPCSATNGSVAHKGLKEAPKPAKPAPKR